MGGYDLAVFDARLDVCVCGLDEPGESCVVGGGAGSQLDVAHELVVALQVEGGVGQGRTLKEADVDVRGEDVDVGEGCVAEAGGRAAVVEELADFVSAVAHCFKTLLRDGAKFAGMIVHPGVDGGIVCGGTVRSEDSRFHRNFGVHLGSILHSPVERTDGRAGNFRGEARSVALQTKAMGWVIR